MDIKIFLQSVCIAIGLACINPLSLQGQTTESSIVAKTDSISVDKLEEFMNDNPQAIEIKILSEGTMAYLCANDSDLFVRLSVGHPMLFMRMLMQGLTIHIDPTGAKKKKFAFVFPSARDVQQKMNSTSSSIIKDSKERPNVGPLVEEMNKIAASFIIDGKEKPIELTRSLIELDTENEQLNFYALIPKTEMMKEKKLVSDWSIGLYLDSPIGVLEGPRKGNMGAGPTQVGTRERDSKGDDKEIEKLMKKKINVWAKFSIEEANSVNL